MTGTLVAWATIVGTAVSVLTILMLVRSSARRQATDQQKALAEAFERGKKEGAVSCKPEIALLTSERDDARRERDVQQAQSEEGWRRYNDLRDRRAR